MKKIQALLLTGVLVVTMSLMYSFPARVSAAGTETQLEFNGSEGYTPAIYGDNVVWADTRNGNPDIYLYNLVSGSEKQITSEPSDQVRPKIYRDLIVWEDYRNTPYSRIYLYNLTSKTEIQVSGGTSHQSNPAISGNRIVWQDDRDPAGGVANPDHNWSIYLNGPTPGSEYNISPLAPGFFSQENPALFRDLVVWMDRRNGDYYNIYMNNLTSHQETQITTDTHGQENPAIYGNRIVWADGRTSYPYREIFINGTAPGREYSLTPSLPASADARYPEIYGSKVVWQQDNLTTYNYDIFMNDTSVSGSLIPVALDAAVLPNLKPRLFTDPTYGDRVVWQDDRSGSNSVSLYTSNPGTPAACPVANFSSDFAGGDAPVTVHFSDITDITLSLVTHRFWEFGDGSSAMDPSPAVHTYTVNNPYTVTLTVSNPWCRNATAKPAYIVVGRPVANFVGSPTSDIVPVSVSFTDTSVGTPETWNWSFGDTAWFNTTDPARKNATHVYTTPGTYSVSLTVNNTFGSNTSTRSGYILALRGANELANTTIAGLAVSSCSGPQTITVNSSVVPASLTPNASVLELQPPAHRGFRNITIYALDGTGFTRAGTIITGHVTGVHLQTKDIVPAGFSSTGPVSVNYSIDLPLYPCDATLNTKIWEDAIPSDRDKFERIAIGSTFAHYNGTLYTTKISKTNFPAEGTVILHMSADSVWVAGNGGPGQIYVEHILEDGQFGEVLRTRYISSDTLKHLDYFEADSPRGLSTFGLSALSGAGNIAQLVTLSIASHVNPPGPVNPSSDSDGNIPVGTATITIPTTTPVPTTSPTGVPADPGKSAKVYTNANGVVTQATRLQSTDSRAIVTIGEGIVAKDAGGKPLTAITIKATPPASLPVVPSGSGFTFAGMAYDLGPDGATFSPPASLSFFLPQAQWGQDYSVKSFDQKSGTWQDLPTAFDAATGTVTAHFSHLCVFALFTEPRASTVPPPAGTPLPVPTAPQVNAQPPTTAVSIFTTMMAQVAGLVVNNAVVFVGIIILAIAVYVVKQGRFPGSGR
jgi:beta propeller repeat protein